MMNTGSGEFQNPINGGYTPIQPNPGVLITRSTITPSKRVAIKTKVFQSTEVQSIPETLHLSLWSIQPTQFLLSKQNFIEITHTHPRQRWTVAQVSKKRLGVFPAGCIKVSIEIYETPGVIHSVVNNGINMSIGRRLHIHINIRFPIQSKATTWIDTRNKEKISKLNPSTNFF